MNDVSRLTAEDADAIATLIRGLNRTDGYLGDDYYMTTDQEDRLRLWNRDGYSPGYIVMPDDFWLFTPEYREAQ